MKKHKEKLKILLGPIFILLFSIISISQLFAQTKFEQQNAIIRIEAERIKTLGHPIMLLEYFSRSPDNLGNVTVLIRFMNISKLVTTRPFWKNTLFILIDKIKNIS